MESASAVFKNTLGNFSEQNWLIAQAASEIWDAMED